MNYLKLFTSASGLFPKRINVTLIDAATGSNLGRHKIPAEQLPVAFNRPTILEINDINWRVLGADPILADDFLFTKKLRLHVQHIISSDAQQLKFGSPSVCNELPPTAMASLYCGFTLELAITDWRQMEFLPLNQSGMVEDIFKAIESILNGQPNPLLGYEQQYIRNAQPSLDIPWDNFCALLDNSATGNISFNGNGFIVNGFAVRSDNHTYYGLLENGLIHVLCLTNFDFVDDELMQLLSACNLSLVDWCNTIRISAETGEEPKSEFIKL